MNPIERAKAQTVQFALQMGRKPRLAAGGIVTGPLIGPHGGRTDTLPIAVPSGAYVLPADVVSGIPGAEGNSLAGHAALTKLFAQLPSQPTPIAGPPAAGLGMAKGGKTDAHIGKPVDIMAAGGEFVIPPEAVRAMGNGDLNLGHEVMDHFVKKVREKNIMELRKLPGPVKR